MTYADVETMQTLIVLIDCRCVALMESGELHAVMDGADRAHVVLDDRCISELVRREWLEMHEAGGELLVNVTPAGNYWGERWFRQTKKAERRAAGAKL